MAFSQLPSPPSSDAAVFAGGKYDLLLIQEAKRSHNVVSMGPRQTNTIGRVERPFLLGVFGQKEELKELFTTPKNPKLATKIS